MTRVNWGVVGERYYESGVDCGVLYVGDYPGVSWSGLISISEQPSGGRPKPYYVDGVKYLNLSSAEEFEATINAVSYPPEFKLCDGIASAHNGLFATQQPRRSFGLSYRSLVGNDIDADGHGYKIHLVYNALASPSRRNNQSLGGSPTILAFNWRISTLAPAITGFRRTAHLVIESKLTPFEVLTEVGDILYGTEMTPPRLPEPDELVVIFGRPYNDMQFTTVPIEGGFPDSEYETSHDGGSPSTTHTMTLDGGNP